MHARCCCMAYDLSYLVPYSAEGIDTKKSANSLASRYGWIIDKSLKGLHLMQPFTWCCPCRFSKVHFRCLRVAPREQEIEFEFAFRYQARCWFLCIAVVRYFENEECQFYKSVVRLRQWEKLALISHSKKLAVIFVWRITPLVVEWIILHQMLTLLQNVSLFLEIDASR